MLDPGVRRKRIWAHADYESRRDAAPREQRAQDQGLGETARVLRQGSKNTRHGHAQSKTNRVGALPVRRARGYGHTHSCRDFGQASTLEQAARPRVGDEDLRRKRKLFSERHGLWPREDVGAGHGSPCRTCRSTAAASAFGGAWAGASIANTAVRAASRAQTSRRRIRRWDVRITVPNPAPSSTSGAGGDRRLRRTPPVQPAL